MCPHHSIVLAANISSHFYKVFLFFGLLIMYFVLFFRSDDHHLRKTEASAPPFSLCSGFRWWRRFPDPSVVHIMIITIVKIVITIVKIVIMIMVL